MKKSLFVLILIISLLMSNINAVENENYVKIPRFFNAHVNDVEKLLTDNGLKCNFEYDYNHNPEGTVYSIVFYGDFDDDYFNVKPNSTVTLKVSLGKYYPKNANADSDKVIYLTFDDGPTKANTDRLVEILGNYEIKATFFLVGNPVQYYREKVKTVFNAGHAIGCHSVTHKYNDIYRTSDAFIEDIRLWESIVYDITGELDYKLYRFPGGSPRARYNLDTYNGILDKLHEADYYAFDWTMSNSDVQSKGSLAYAKSSFLSQLDKMEKAGSTVPKIVLMHETYNCTVDMLEWMIDLLIERGYRFDTLDNLDGNWFM